MHTSCVFIVCSCKSSFTVNAKKKQKKKKPTWQAKARMLLIHNPLNNDLLCKGVELAHEIQIAG